MAGKSDSVSIRVPYKNLHDDSAATELELVDVDHRGRRIHVNSPPSTYSPSPTSNKASLVNLVLSCTVAAGVQFGWALQLSLLTPYIQVRYWRLLVSPDPSLSRFDLLLQLECGFVSVLVVEFAMCVWSVTS